MIRLTPIISAGLMTVLVPLTSLKAQKADTLKRQLQVVTSEEVKLSEQKALPLLGDQTSRVNLHTAR